MRTKSEFKALREMCGLTQSALADMLGVKVLSVKRWENQTAPQNAPQDAWDILDRAMSDQRTAIDTALNEVNRIAKKTGRAPNAFRLPYWSSEEEYLAYSTDAQLGVSGNWRMANASIRALATVLINEGYAVEWVDGGVI